MRLLFRFPTFGRSVQFFQALARLEAALTREQDWRISVIIEATDKEMNRKEILERLAQDERIDFSVRHTDGKHAAYNAELHVPWDIYIAYADDLEPKSISCDARIVRDMAKEFPDTDGCIWYFDGQHRHLNTHPVIGRKYYERFGYIFHPSYRGLCADIEHTEVAGTLGRSVKKNECLFRHNHFKFMSNVPFDDTYRRSWNRRIELADQRNLDKRKAAGYPKEWIADPLPEPVKLPAMKNLPRLLVFWHIGQLPGWKEIVREQWDLLDAMKLTELATIYTNTVAKNGAIRAFEPYMASVKWLADCSHNASDWEMPTLRAMHAIVQPTDFILYMHTKGIMHLRDKGYKEWRYYMQWGCLEHWPDCIAALQNGFNAAGVELCLESWRGLVDAPFFAGNFWWARGEYILSLTPDKLDRENRWSAEGWLATGKDFRPKCLHTIGDPNDKDIAANGILKPGFCRLTYTAEPEIC